MKKTAITAFLVIMVLTLKAQWEPDVRLTNNSGLSNTSLPNAWCVAASGDSIHVVWMDYRDGNNEIYYKRSTDGGITWGTDTRLTSNADESSDPAIAVWGSGLHIVWCDDRDGNYEIYYKCSLNGGDSWGADVRLTDDPHGSIYPSIAVQDSIVYVTWQDERDGNNGEIYYKRSDNKGKVWSYDMRLTYNSDYSGLPSIAVSGSIVHIVWEDYRDANGEIYYIQSTDLGISWGSETPISNTLADSWDPSIAVADSLVHIVYYDHQTGDDEIYYVRSTDWGASWEANQRITYSTGISRYPNIAASGSLVHATWEDYRMGNYEIYYDRSYDGGATWETNKRLTNAAYNSQNASVALSDSAVHVVWYDKRDFNDEIYYKKDPTGNIPLSTGISIKPSLQEQVVIFPNPASSVVYVQTSGGSFVNSLLTIRDILGKVVARKKISQENTQVDVSLFPEGLYFVEVENATGLSGFGRFVITR